TQVRPVATPSTLDDAGPPLLPLHGRSVLDTSGDGPYVSRRIDNPPRTVAPELVLHGKQNPRPGGHRPLDHSIHVFDIDVDHHGRSAIRLRSTARKGWPLCFDDDHRTADRQQRMDHVPIRTWSAPQFHGAKRGLAEVDLSRNVAAHQHRYHNRGVVGY